MVELLLCVVLAVPPAAVAPVAPVVDDEDALGTDDVVPSVGDTRAVKWSLTTTHRSVVATGLTTVAVETSAPTPTSGFFALKVEIDNSKGPGQDLKLVFSPSSPGGRPVSRTVAIRQGERRTVALPVPFHWRYGQLRAYGPGIQEQQSPSVYLSSVYPQQPVVLSLGSADETEKFMHSRPLTNSSASNLTVVTWPAEHAPTELAAYVGYHAVVLPTAALETLTEGQRQALEAYAATGGNLILGAPSRAVAAALPLWRDDAKGTYGLGRVSLCGSCTPTLGLFAHEPPVTPSSSDGRRDRYAYRHADTMEPLLPQATVPVGRFLVIILLFTLAIGPGSVWVARRRGPSALLVTVPGIALATCVLIIGIAAFRDGFTVHATSGGYTLLDSQRHRAITVGLTAYYANLGPSGASLPATSTIVGPNSESNDAFAASLDWTNGLALGSDFVPSRTYREWGFVSVEPTRARLVVKDAGERLLVQNALGAEIDQAFVRSQGELYVVRDLRDGQEAPATRVSALTRLALESRVMSRFQFDKKRFEDPLADGEFLAMLDGQGFTPTAGLKLSLSTSQHLVKGEVER